MKGDSPSYTANYCGLAELQTKTRTNLVNNSILSHSAQLSYMLGAADISSRQPDRSSFSF